MKWQAMATTQEDLPWLIERVGCFLTPAAKGVKAVDQHGTIRGMVLFDRWTYNAAEAHIALDSGIALRVLCREAFPWYFAKREIIIGLVRSSNTRALELDLRLGFKVHARIDDGVAKGEDLLLLRMTKSDCRWPTTMPQQARSEKEASHGHS